MRKFNKNKKKHVLGARAVIVFVTIGILLLAAMVLAMKPTTAMHPNQPDQITWLPPLSIRDEYEPCCKIPIKFQVKNETGRYLWDKSVRVTIINEIGKVVYDVKYKPGGNGLNDIKIYHGRFYITYWHPPGFGHKFDIYVTFDDWPGVYFVKTVYINN